MRFNKSMDNFLKVFLSWTSCNFGSRPQLKEVGLDHWADLLVKFKSDINNDIIWHGRARGLDLNQVRAPNRTISILFYLHLNLRSLDPSIVLNHYRVKHNLLSLWYRALAALISFRISLYGNICRGFWRSGQLNKNSVIYSVSKNHIWIIWSLKRTIIYPFWIFLIKPYLRLD